MGRRIKNWKKHSDHPAMDVASDPEHDGHVKKLREENEQ